MAFCCECDRDTHLNLCKCSFTGEKIQGALQYFKYIGLKNKFSYQLNSLLDNKNTVSKKRGVNKCYIG